mmetsp:Transcript_28580/g.51760  ORF Transcript_28580/g.51760 Transcript_28580/m.51760 type:complete len:169 (-) Transcript_28580:125-631(-)
MQKASQLFAGLGRVQVEIDYSKGFWKSDEPQLGMVGISDADKKFHPVAIGVQKSENGTGSAAVLDLVTEMLTRSGAVPDCCLKDVPLLKLSPLVPVKHNSFATTASHTSLVFRSSAEEGFEDLEDPWQGTCFQSRTTKPRNESTHFQMFAMFNRTRLASNTSQQCTIG